MDSLTGFGRHFGGMGRALSARNYRVYWYGHLFSSNGGWIFLISSQWLIFHLTESPIWLGAIGFAYLAPLFFLGPLAGAISDRYGHRRTGIIAASFGIVVSLLTALAITTGVLTPKLMIILTIFQGTFFAFDFPARQALIPQLIERKNLSAAIGMNWATYCVAGFTGPVVGGAILSLGNSVYGKPMGAAMSYTASAFALSCIVLALTQVRVINPLRAKKQIEHIIPAVWSDLKAGIYYIVESTHLKIIMGLSVFVALFLRSYQNLMAGFAKEVFHLDEQGLGNMLALSGAGALFVAIILAIRGKTDGLTRVFICGIAMSAIALLVFVSNTHITSALVTVTFIGGLIVATELSAQTLVQNIVADEYRARVISISLAVTVGSPAFGTFAIGWFAEIVGLQIALGISAIIALIAVIIFGRKLLAARAEVEAKIQEAE
jgi:MFS family permease